MMTVGGQSFANAWKNVMATTNYGTNVPAPTLKGGGANPAYLAYLNSLPAQPFFESAFNTSYCGSVIGATSCTSACVAKKVGNIRIYDALYSWSTVSFNSD